MHARLTRTVVAIAGSLALVATATPAGAATYDHFHYDDAFADTFDACGTSWSFDFHATGNVILRLSKNDPDLVLAQDVNSSTNTYTNLGTGRSFTFSGHERLREVEASRTGDIITVRVDYTGMPVRMTSDTGATILKDRGLLEVVQTFEVVNHELNFLGEEVVRDVGAHPLYYADFCDVALAATT